MCGRVCALLAVAHYRMCVGPLRAFVPLLRRTGDGGAFSDSYRTVSSAIGVHSVSVLGIGACLVAHIVRLS